MPRPSTRSSGLRNYSDILTDPSFYSTIGRTRVLHDRLDRAGARARDGLALLLNAPLQFRWLFRSVVVLPWALPTIVNGAMWRGGPQRPVRLAEPLLTQLASRAIPVWLGTPFLALNMVIVADVWKNTSLVAFFLLAGLQIDPARNLRGGARGRRRADPGLVLRSRCRC